MLPVEHVPDRSCCLSRGLGDVYKRQALDIMGKAHVLLEMLSESTDTSTPSKK